MIVLFGKDSCGPCNQLKKYFGLKKVDYEYRDVADPTNAKRAFELSGLTMVPIVQINEKVISGYNLQALAELL